jgi:hypothetical protein
MSSLSDKRRQYKDRLEHLREELNQSIRSIEEQVHFNNQEWMGISFQDRDYHGLRVKHSLKCLERSEREYNKARDHINLFLKWITDDNREAWEQYQTQRHSFGDIRFYENAYELASNFFGEGTESSGIRSLAEEILQRAGIREGLEEYVERIMECVSRIEDLKGGYGSMGVVDIGGEVIKIGTKAQIEKERDVYELLKGTESAKKIPEYKDSKTNEEVGLMRLGRIVRASEADIPSLDALLRNPEQYMDAYIGHNLKLMAQFHADLTRRAKEEGVYDEFTTEQGYNTNSNPDLELLTDPLQNERIYRKFKKDLPSKQAIDRAKKNAEEVKAIIREESGCLIHGDWKPENTELENIYDFSDVRKGDELEDIMRFLTSSFVNCSKEEARYSVDKYIQYRSKVDVEFRENTAKQARMRRYADKFYEFEGSVYALRANKRDLRLQDKQHERIVYLGNLEQAA